MLLAGGLLSACAAGRLTETHQIDQALRQAELQPAAMAASAVQVVGPQGAMAPAPARRVIAQVAAEGEAGLLRHHLAVMGAQSRVRLYSHNRVRLLEDGPATFDAMFAAVERARSSVMVQSYIVDDAELAQRLARLLARKRAEGVEVALLRDAVGSFGTDPALFEALRQQGVPSCEFNPVNPLRRLGHWGLLHRDHRKIVVVDRETAFTGGINISAVYASGSWAGSSGRRPPEGSDPAQSGWRDTQVEIRGPAAVRLDALVRTTWQRQGCEAVLAPPQEPSREQPAEALGDDVVRVVASGPDEPGDNRIHATLLGAIAASRRSVHLTMAYFAPGDRIVEALCEAARRGVDVQLVLPSMSDFAPVLHAGRARYEQLLSAGVRIHELQHSVLHAKTFVVDGVLSSVGSSNMDWRSFTGNDEVNAFVLGRDFGAAMERMFGRDVADSRPVTLASWRERPWPGRLVERAALMFERLW